MFPNVAMTEHNVETHRHLVLTDVDAIQSYLFSSVRLSTIAGASRIIVEFDHWLKTAAETQYGGWVLSHSGGSAVVLFDDEDNAQKFLDEAGAKFAAMSVSGHLTTAGPHKAEPLQFAKAMKEAERELETNNRLAYAQPEPLVVPLARRCAACGREPAIAYADKFDPDAEQDGRFLGAACLEKWNVRKQRWKRFAKEESGAVADDWLDWIGAEEPWSKLDPDTNFPRSFSQLVQERERMAVVVADVNEVGRRRQQLTDPVTFDSFAEGLRGAMQASLVHAIRETTRDFNPDRDIFPVHVLFHGGDDVVLACRGDVALPLMQQLTTEFMKQNENKTWNQGQPLGLSAAAVIAGSSFPFRIAHAIASRLVKEAKRTAREQCAANHGEWHHGAIDFAVVTEAYADAETVLNDRVFKDDSNVVYLSGRPYCVAPDSPRSFANFRDACRALARAGFPRSRLHDLRMLCSKSSLAEVAEEAPLSVPAKARQEWKRLYQDWLARIARNPGLGEQWGKICRRLKLVDGFVAGEPNNTWRTCLGDFADAVPLWKAMDE